MKTILLSLAFFFSFLTNAFSQFGVIDSSFSHDGKLTSQYYSAGAYCVAVLANRKILAGGYKESNLNFERDFLLIRYNEDGSLDTTFGIDGIVTTDLGGELDQALAIAIQKDSKILLAGRTTFDNAVREDYFGITRYNKDGSLDISFGTNGKIVSAKQHFLGEAHSITELSDNKILVAGRAYDPNDGTSFLCVAKYDSNGAPDSSFGENGIRLIDFDENRVGGIFIYDPTDMLIQPDGKILIGSTMQSQQHPYTFSDFVVVRINENGTIDSSFASNGLITDTNDSFDEFGSFFLLPDGKIIVTGNTSSDHSLSVENDSIFAMRFEKDGIIDNSFGGNGRVVFSYENKGGSVSTASSLLPTGEMLIGGYSYLDSSFLLTALNRNGTIDNSFGTNGFTITSFDFEGSNGNTYNAFAFAYDMNLSPDGKIVLAGSYNYYSIGESYAQIALARYQGQTVLPITLSFFSGTKNQNSILLNWQTTSEINNSYFSIERSNNNIDGFKEIGKVNSKDNSSQVQQYNYEDNIPLNGLNYYRLKQVNKDGSTTISKIVLVNFTRDVIIKLYPNPVKSILNIDGLTGSKTILSIIDVKGKVVSIATTTNTTYNWNIKALAAGNYYLSIKTLDKVTTIKFLKE
jgi:uncharacterized delta-60 repeat protein